MYVSLSSLSLPPYLSLSPPLPPSLSLSFSLSLSLPPSLPPSLSLSLSLSLSPSGKQWIRQMIFSTCLFPLLVSSVAILVNIVALFYHASRAIPVTSMVSLVTIDYMYLYTV